MPNPQQNIIQKTKRYKISKANNPYIYPLLVVGRSATATLNYDINIKLSLPVETETEQSPYYPQIHHNQYKHQSYFEYT